MTPKPTAGTATPWDEPRGSAAWLAIARAVSGTSDVDEALRLVCRELAHLTGADTVAAYVADPAHRQLRPVAAYQVPEIVLPALWTRPIPVAEQGFHNGLFRDRRAIGTDDVAGDPRFASEVIRAFPHQSAAVVPLVVDDQVAAGFYLVWWTVRRQLAGTELAMLEAVGQQVGLLLRNARLSTQARRPRQREATQLQEVIAAGGAMVGDDAGRADSPLDRLALDELRAIQADGERDFVARLIDIFLCDTESRLATLREVIARGDAETLRCTAHALKGSSATIGARELSARCGELEAHGKAGNMADAGSVLAAVVEELERVRPALEAERRTTTVQDEK